MIRWTTGDPRSVPGKLICAAGGIVFAAFIAGCGQPAPAVSRVAAPTGWAAPTPTLAPPPRLAVVLHGFNSNVQTFSTTEPGLSLLAGLRAQGWKVIVPEEPFATNPALVRADISKDGGVGYRKAWDAMFRADVAAAGPVSMVMVVGISWGGLHSLLAACDDRQVTALVVHMPVVQASNLTELAGLSLPGLRVGCGSHLSTLTGQFSYGTIDARVGVAPSVALGKSVASCTMRVIAEPEGHETSTADVALMLAGVNAMTHYAPGAPCFVAP